MSRELIYKFQELPLLIDHGFSAGLVSGQAVIAYWPDGEWGVTEIYLEGCRRRPTRDIVAELKTGGPVKSWEEKLVPVERGTELHSLILGRLLDEWRGYVCDKVQDVLEQERAA